MVDDGATPVPLENAYEALEPRALACARCKPDTAMLARWGSVHVATPAGCSGGARRAVAIIRGRSYPSLFGGMFASPCLTLLPPDTGLFRCEEDCG